jgi:hypothetical protein
VASILLERLRALALKETEAACYQAHTFRVLLSSACPDQALFLHTARVLINFS